MHLPGQPSEWLGCFPPTFLPYQEGTEVQGIAVSPNYTGQLRDRKEHEPQTHTLRY